MVGQLNRGDVTRKIVRPAKQTRQAERSRQVAILRALGDQLVGAALSAGLCLQRPQSLPARVTVEAQRFLQLLALALGKASDRALDRAALAEARTGAFAGASVEQAERVLALWRETLRSLADGLPHLARRGELDAALDRVRRSVLAACHRAATDRVDILLIGGSAGGIPAVGALLGQLDKLTAASVLIVLHTHPSAPALKPLVLSKYGSMPVSYPADGGFPHLGHAYVAPPGRHLGVEEGRLRLLDRPQVRFSRPSIDVLFESAAECYGPRVASVVVSGTGRDGADGTVAVHRHGGITLAQDPESAEFDAMPQAAVHTGTVRRVAPLPALGKLLGRLVAEGASALGKEAP
jgi:two-component system chemotaxis response regulator CheB